MRFLNPGLFIASLMLTTNIMAQQKPTIATHIETGDGTATNEWMDPVDDGAYNQLGE